MPTTSPESTLTTRWDHRYQNHPTPGAPAPVLSAHHYLLPATGDALDLACGLGANALLLARAGLATQAWDISGVALQILAEQAAGQGLAITTLQRDIEASPPPPACFDVIVVTDFLHRPLCPAIAAALRPGGLLFYATWCADKRASGGPSNPAFLLQPNELLHLFSGLQIRHYREDAQTGDLRHGDRDRAHLVAQRPC